MAQCSFKLYFSQQSQQLFKKKKLFFITVLEQSGHNTVYLPNPHYPFPLSSPLLINPLQSPHSLLTSPAVPDLGFGTGGP